MKPTAHLSPLLFAAALFASPLLPAQEAAPTPPAPAAIQLKTDNPEYLQGIKKVVITHFMVDFVSDLKYSKNLSGLEALMGADSDVSIKLVGSNPEQYQALTDQFYDQTVARLKAQGLEVVDQTTLEALPEYQDLKAQGVTPVPSEQDAKAGKGLFFTAKGLPLQLIDEAHLIPSFNAPFTKPKQDLFLTFGSRFSGGFAAGQAMLAEENIAKKLGATLVKVRLTVLGGQLVPDSNFWLNGKVSTRASANFVDFVTRYAFITPDGRKARIALDKPFHTQDIGELVNVTSGDTKTADTAKNTALVALNVVAFAARMNGVGTPGVSGYAATSEYECRVQPEAFAATLLSHHDQLAEQFTARMLNPAAQ